MIKSDDSPAPASILIVDDDPGKRLSLCAVLEPLGHVIVEAQSGEAALRAVMGQTFAVILMDVHMPGMSGYETARLIRMRAESELTPIIFITADTTGDPQGPIAYESGAIDFMVGTVVPGILRAKVSIFMELFLRSRALELSLGHVATLGASLRDSEAHVRAVLDNVADGIVTLDEDARIESFNRAASDLFGYAPDEVIGLPFAMLVPGTGDPGVTFDAAEQRSSHIPSVIAERKGGDRFSLELDLSEVRLGERLIQIACLRDVSSQRLYTDGLQRAALHDPLTGLPNRVLFAERAEHAIRAAVRTNESVALLLLDLNGFKDINDTLGHHCGDLLLKVVAERLTGCLRDGDTVARLGGDEFAILPMGNTDLAGAATVVWSVEQALKPGITVEGQVVDISASIGIALAPEHGDQVSDLLRRADLAMYDAKRTGTGYAIFAAEHEDGPVRRLELLTDLRSAIANDELVLHYQPKVDLKTRRTTGVEALIRWNHPTNGLLQPGAFIPEVENTELIVSITKWVLDTALHQLHDWRQSGHDLTMAINISARCLSGDVDFFEHLEALETRWEIPPDRLTLELTEGALIDTKVPGLLERLETMSERLSIDDFGTGYSSLVYLRRLPVVEIKADRSFVSSMATVREDAVIVCAIIDLAHNLGLEVVAEGIEDEATMEQLIAAGCDTAQGYYFSRPVPSEQLLEWLSSSGYGSASVAPLEIAARRA